MVVVVVALGVLVYLAPTAIAANRSAPHFGSIAVIDIFLGWTVVGWVVALALAMRDVPADY